MVYSTDRFKAVVPVWSYSLLLCGLFYEAICFSFAWCYFVLVFFSPFSIAITSLGEERSSFSVFRAFVRFELVWFCLFPFPLGVSEGLRFVIVIVFPLPLGVSEGLRFVIVALPGLFSYLLFTSPALFKGGPSVAFLC